MYILDTDTLTHLWVGHPRVVERLHAIDDPDVGATIVTKAELLRGRIEFLLKAVTGIELIKAQRLFARTEELLSLIVVIPFDEAAAMQFERLRVGKGLKKVGRADLLIASICIAQQATLVTRNVRHFRQVNGLNIENWVD